MMRRLKLILFVGLLLCVISCKETKDMVTNHNIKKAPVTPELLDYFADSRVTRYSYYIKEGDICQMGLKENTIYISHTSGENGIVVNVVVK